MPTIIVVKPAQYGTQVYPPIKSLLDAARDGEDAIPIYLSLSAAVFWYFEKLTPAQQKEARRQLKEWLKKQSEAEADNMIDDAESTPVSKPNARGRRRRNRAVGE